MFSLISCWRNIRWRWTNWLLWHDKKSWMVYTITQITISNYARCFRNYHTNTASGETTALKLQFKFVVWISISWKCVWYLDHCIIHSMHVFIWSFCNEQPNASCSTFSCDNCPNLFPIIPQDLQEILFINIMFGDLCETSEDLLLNHIILMNL